MSDAIHYFPKDFKWGTATAAHQVEGGNTRNQWARWEETPGKIANGERSGLACDWWNNAEADFDRMADMGLNAHRLSVEWSRIEPEEGRFDAAALERYRAMLLALRQRGIEPMVTLHHFTDPLWLADQGGWENRDLAVPRFERYVRRVVAELGDLCDLWCTVNEPNVMAVVGWVDGRTPPGRRGDLNAALTVVQNLLLGHAAAWQALHDVQRFTRVGLAHHMRKLEPLRHGNLMDIVLARAFSSLFNDGILEALVRGRWPLLMRRGSPPDARKLKGTLDWIGLNYYTRERVIYDGGSPATLYARLAPTPGAEMSDFGYGEIHPQGMMHFMRQLARTGLPIYITENGLPDADDDQRPGFIMQHLKQVWLATNFNYGVRGYYWWSFMDNFEWSDGWRMKFGLYGLDPATQARTLRRGGMLYRDIVRANALTSDQAREYAPAMLNVLFP